MAEITKTADINNEKVKAHLAGKFKADKEIASPSEQNAKYGAPTLLWWAAYGGHAEAVAALLKAGANKNFKAKTGESCLDIAVKQDRSDEVIKLLGGTPKPKTAPATAAPAAAKPATTAAAAKPATTAAAAKPATTTAAKPTTAAPAAKAAAPPAAVKAAAPAAAKPATTAAAKPATTAAAKPATTPAKKG